MAPIQPEKRELQRYVKDSNFPVGDLLRVQGFMISQVSLDAIQCTENVVSYNR